MLVVVGRRGRVREEMQPVGSSLLEQEEEEVRRRRERSSPNNNNRHSHSRHNRRQLENTEQGMSYLETSFFLDRS